MTDKSNWKLVPVEPTQEMTRAGGEVDVVALVDKFLAADIYRAMLNAAPASPSPPPSAGVDAVAVRALRACEASLTEIERDHPEWMRDVDRRALSAARSALTPAPTPVEAGGEAVEQWRWRYRNGEPAAWRDWKDGQPVVPFSEWDADRYEWETRTVYLAKPSLAVENELLNALSAEKPFVFDPGTGFAHADDGGAPEHGVLWAPLAKPAPAVDAVREDCATIVDAAAEVARSQADECRDRHPERAERYDASAIALDEAAALIRAALAPAAQAGTAAQEGRDA